MKLTQQRPAVGALALSLAGVFALASASSAAVINENFEDESLTVTNGDSFTDQNNNWEVPFRQTTTADNIIQDATTTNGTQVLELGPTQGDEDGNNRAVETKDSAFDTATGDIPFSADLYADSGTNAMVLFFTQDDDIQERGVTITFTKVGGNRIRALTGGSNTPVTNSSGSNSQWSDQTWYRVDGTINLDPTTGSGTNSTFDVSITDLGTNTEIGSLSNQTIAKGDPVNIGKVRLQTSDPARFDNVSYAVPAPGSLALLGLGGLLMVGRRRCY